jgi:hypothetical protein
MLDSYWLSGRPAALPSGGEIIEKQAFFDFKFSFSQV